MSAPHAARHGAYEHDFEPVPGLPGRLPEGETILWQGAPNWSALAVHAMHVRWVTLYFAAIIVAQGLSGALGPTPIGADGISLARAAGEAVWTAAFGLLAIGLLCLYAGLIAKTSLYTITNRRVVMRVGVAIPKAVNLPFAIIESAALRRHPGDTGDLPLQLKPEARAGYILLWPHVRPWRWNAPEPMLRAIPDAGGAAKILADALEAYQAEHRPVEAPSPPTPQAAHARPPASAPAAAPAFSAA
jgi:hypothetical protein